MHTRLRGRGAVLLVASPHTAGPRVTAGRRGQRRSRHQRGVGEPRGPDPARHERVGRRDHPGRQQDHRRRDVHLGEPGGTFGNTSDDVVRNRIFAFDATTGAIDPAFNPNLGGAAHSLDTDGTSIYVGGSFASVGGDPSIKRLVKLTAAGSVVSGFKAVPNAGVNEVVVRGSRVYVGGGFTSVRSRTVTSLARGPGRLDSATGAVLAGVNVAFTGVYDPNNDGGGTTNIGRFDVSPDGSRLAAVGNFATVGGQPRVQLAVLDTGGDHGHRRPGRPTGSTGHTTTARACSTRSCGTSTSPRTGPTSWCRPPARSPAGWAAGRCATPSPAGRPPARATTRPGSDYTGGDTTYGVAVTGSVPCTSAATCAG